MVVYMHNGNIKKNSENTWKPYMQAIVMGDKQEAP